MGRSRSLARRGPDVAVTSSPSTSEPVQSINNNMSAVELAPIEATGSTTSSSGSCQSSTALSQPNHPQATLQSVGGGSEAAAEQLVEADGACTSSSGSSHPSTSSAREGGGASTSGVNPSRKRSWTTASCTSVHPEVSESQLGLSISNDTTNAVNDTMVGTSVPPTLQVAVQLPLPLVQASRPATTTEPESYDCGSISAPGCTSRSDHKIPPVQTGGSACISHAAHQHRHDGSRTTSCQCYSRCDSFHRIIEHLTKHVQSTSPSGYAVHPSQRQTCGDCSRSGEQCATDKR